MEIPWTPLIEENLLFVRHISSDRARRVANLLFLLLYRWQAEQIRKYELVFLEGGGRGALSVQFHQYLPPPIIIYPPLVSES